MEIAIIQEAALHFGNTELTITPIKDGLIHATYKVDFRNNDTPIILQNINRSTFSEPEQIIHNYLLIEAHLKKNGGMHIPSLVMADDGKYFWENKNGLFWRATEFETNSTILPFPKVPGDAYKAAHCFGRFTNDLSTLDPGKLKATIPDFHSLGLRLHQFETAIKNAAIKKLLKATHVIAELRQRTRLVAFYNSLAKDPAYKERIMHHDCKMSNILLDVATKQVLGPIDLDTVMPGRFFSDIGDLIRSMAGTVDENSTRWEEIDIRKDFYEAIINGYLEGIGNTFTNTEKENIHYAGQIMIYMQSMRFVTDFLNNDIYYNTTYPEQNLNRALNQLLLLERLEEFLQTNYRYSATIS